MHLHSAIITLDEKRENILLEEFERIGKNSEIAFLARQKFAKSSFIYFIPYLIISICLIIAESVTVGFPYSTIEAQKVILALSTVFYLYGVVACEYHITSDIRGILRRYRIILLDGVTLFETIFIVLGWICIYRDLSGFAALRILRVFRYLWYFELNDTKKAPYNSISHMSLRCVQYMNNLGKELFTSSSKGGLMIIAVYFFLTYAVAVAVWTEQVRLCCNLFTIAISYLKDRGRK